MRQRAPLLVLLGATLLSLSLAYWRQLALEEEEQKSGELKLRHTAAARSLYESVEKNLELSRELTRVSEETASHASAARKAEAKKTALERDLAALRGKLERRGHELEELKSRFERKDQEVNALTERLEAVETSVDESVTLLRADRKAAAGNAEKLAQLRSALESGLEAVRQLVAPLAERVDTLGELAAANESRRATSFAEHSSRLTEQLTRLEARLDDHERTLRTMVRKIEILGRMLAVGRGPEFHLDAAGALAEELTATVEVVDAEKREVALRMAAGNTLRRGHVLWIRRDGTAVARVEVFSVDEEAGLAAARVLWMLPGDLVRAGDTATTRASDGAAPAPAGVEGAQGAADGSDAGDSPAPAKALEPRSRPPSPPLRPDP